MKIVRIPSRPRNKGYALILTLVLSAATLLVLSSALGWTSTNSAMTERNNQFFRTVSAAEAATEKVLTRVSQDYRTLGEAGVTANVDSYRTAIPTSTESSLVANYAFSDAWGSANRITMDMTSPMSYRVLNSQYAGLYGYATTYRIISNARETTGRLNITAALRQDLDVATIPLFQFAIFYNLDLEINPGPVMTVTGPVHGNQSIYLQPQATLTFQSQITAVGSIVTGKKPGDPLTRTAGAIVFNDEHDGGVSSLNLPIGTNNSPASVREVVEIPPVGESPTSDMGKQRYYNKADLIIKVSSAGVVTATSGLVNNFATVIPAGQIGIFCNTAVTFVNKRENKTVRAVQIDVNQLRLWNATNTYLRSVIPLQDVSIIYVSDARTPVGDTTYEPGVRLVNGQLLPPDGLTVATPAPIYVQGHYNCPNAALGTANTTGTLPASLIGDSVTVLSTAWNDANANGALSTRPAANTTVNAAILAGIVETVSGSYSGGVENFPRFLEDWSGDTFTYNGSMVVMYPSKFTTAPWTGTGTYYNPPARNWAFDTNFRNPALLPPGTPSVRALIRGIWTMIQPNTTNAVYNFY